MEIDSKIVKKLDKNESEYRLKVTVSDLDFLESERFDKAIGNAIESRVVDAVVDDLYMEYKKSNLRSYWLKKFRAEVRKKNIKNISSRS